MSKRITILALCFACITAGYFVGTFTAPTPEVQAAPDKGEECSQWNSYDPPVYFWVQECIDGRWTRVEYELQYCEDDPHQTQDIPTGNQIPTSNPCP